MRKNNIQKKNITIQLNPNEANQKEFNQTI